MEKIAAIDIGSNAVRLTTADLISSDNILIDKKIRIPIRLGSEAFSKNQTYSKEFIKYAQFAFIEINKTLKQLNISRCRTVATSAMRDAKNSKDLKKAIHESSGIKINTISGDLEAQLILKAIQNSDLYDKKYDYLLFDLGGGSLELSLLIKGEVKSYESINLGTVRMMEYHKNNDDYNQWIEAKFKKINNFIKKQLINSKKFSVLGTGGNFRRLIKLKQLVLDKKSNSVTPIEIQEILVTLEQTSYLERIQQFELRPDRADVIIPAIQVISGVLENLPVNKIFAPNAGLGQGVILDMSDGKSKLDQIF
ncbi:MAG: hypothetical protein HOO06_12890 [Bdellovibrionaceae bacterium]|jgi:exopolyphosphatase / guanosine-5'-triphosphate,3'-diphosphate pyrophosphatase|nr:hypothetical protein [Pseudobdellovibrionaceae bacterium]